MSNVMKTSAPSYDRLAPLAESPTGDTYVLPLLDIGKRTRLKPDGKLPGEPPRKKQKVANQVSPPRSVNTSVLRTKP